MAVEAISETTDCSAESVHVGMTMLIAYGEGKKPPDEVMPEKPHVHAQIKNIFKYKLVNYE